MTRRLIDRVFIAGFFAVLGLLAVGVIVAAMLA